MADDSHKGEDRGFKVQDRRRFSEGGDPVENVETDADSQASSQESQIKDSPAETEASDKETLPEINFPTFVVSLSTQALMHLGEIPNPLTGKVEKEILAAKQTIDILSLLEEKTRGNLDDGEAKLMEEVLYDLRMKYVQAVRKK